MILKELENLFPISILLLVPDFKGTLESIQMLSNDEVAKINWK